MNFVSISSCTMSLVALVVAISVALAVASDKASPCNSPAQWEALITHQGFEALEATAFFAVGTFAYDAVNFRTARIEDIQTR